jgi:hypothetical protein
MEKINYFSGGMHSDNEPALQPENTFREAWNGNLVAQGENRYSFESVKGTTVSFTIPAHYQQKPYQVIGWRSFIDFLFVLVASDEDDYKPGEAAKVTFDNEGNGTYTPLYYHEAFGLSKEHPIANDDAIVGKPENARICRVTWTDNNFPMSTMNIFDTKFSINIASGSLVEGQQYMVLTTDDASYITYGGDNFAPGRAGDGISQNIFTATSTTTYATTGSGAKVIEYVPLESFYVVPAFAPGSIFYKGWISGGALKAGTYQYFYQLETENGARTAYSYLSAPMYNPTSKIPSNQTISYAEFIANVPGTNTSKGIKLSIDNIDLTAYTKIRIGFIFSQEQGVYDNPKIFYYEDVSDSSIDLTHFGDETILETLASLDDLTTPVISLDKVKTITSTKNILFAGNIGLAEDPEFDLSSSVRCKTIQYLLPSDTLAMTVTNTTSQNQAAGYGMFGHGQVQNASVGNTLAYPYQWYEVIGGNASNYCTYNAVNYYEGGPAGNYFRGVPGTTAITTTGTMAKAVAVIRIQKYTSPATKTAGNYKNIRIENDYTDFKGATVSHYLKSHWRRERYRYGIFVFGRHGQQNFVLFLTDKTIPAQYRSSSDTEFLDNAESISQAIGFEMRIEEYASSWSILRSIGLSFSAIDFNLIATAYGCELADLNKFVSGFSIVRTERDEQVISQGVLWATVDYDGSNSKIQSTNQLSSDKYYNDNGRRKHLYMYHSPDALAGYDNLQTISLNDKVEVTDQYTSLAGTDVGQGYVSNFNYYDKFYTPAAPGGGGIYNKGALIDLIAGQCGNIGRANVGVNIGNGTVLDNNGLAAGFAGGGTDERVIQGIQGVFITTDSDEATYPDGVGKFAGSSLHRTLINWIRPKANLYGGTSDSVKSLNKYIFTGHYQPLDADFMDYMTGTSDGTPGSPSQTKLAGIVNNVEVFGGDAYVSLFGIDRGIREQGGPLSFSSSMVIPIESQVNENWRGRDADFTAVTFNRNRAYNAGENSNGIYYGDGQRIESFLGGDIFVGKEKEFFFVARPLGFVSNMRDEYTVARSLEKINGEIFDNWRVFLLENRITVDSQYGPINNIRAKAYRLFYWQNKGVGYIPVSERQMNSATLGEAVQMGVGGIMERFDELDFYHGNQHQMGLMETDSEFLWFDFRRKKMLRLGFNGSKDILSELRGMDAFLQNLFTEVEAEAGDTIFNSDNPLTGKGIISCYDSRFKLGLMVFKYFITVGDKIIERDFGIGFSKNLDKYVSFFNLKPNHMISHNGHFLMTREVRTFILSSTSYNLFDELYDTTTLEQYVCILSYTSAFIPFDVASDPTHWVLASKLNNVHVGWRGDICKFFGIVYPWNITPVLQGDHLAADAVEVAGNNTRYSDVFIENEEGSASDEGISAGNKNYEYYDGNWNFSLPLKNKKSKLVGNYLKVKLQTKNYVGNAVTTSLNLVKRVFYIKEITRKRK